MVIRDSIRDGKREDVPAIQHVARAIWNHTYQDIIPERVRTEFLNRAYSEESLTYRISSGAFLVAARDGEVVGFSDWHPVSETEVRLAAIYVLPQTQGRGIGSALLLAGLSRFPAASEFYLRVERDNPGARRFYETHGFRVSGEHAEDLLGHRMHELEMVLQTGRRTRHPPRRDRARNILRYLATVR